MPKKKEEELRIGDSSQARFEFRSFGKNFETVVKKMAELSAPVPAWVKERSSDEIYIISKKDDSNNIKIRKKEIEIKTLLKIVDGMEQWKSLIKIKFPISAEMLKNQILPILQIKIVDFKKDQKNRCTQAEFFKIIKQNPEFQIVKVSKQRFGFFVNNTICETANVWIGGVKLASVASESTKTADIKKTIADLGLEKIENINYIQAIKRVVEIVNKPLAN